MDDGEHTWAHVEPGAAEPFAAFLTKMRFMLEVEPEDVTNDYALVYESEPSEVYRRRRPGPPRRLPRDLPSARTPRRVRPHARAPGGTSGPYEALRIAAHRPRVGLETDQRTIPHELGLINQAVHLNKGCYRGQETVARVENLGHPPRRLVMLHLDGTEEHLPPHGSPVLHDGREVGVVTSSARHYEFGPIALALVKRTVPVDAVLQADGVPAGQEVVVAPDTGGTARERLRRPV